MSAIGTKRTSCPLSGVKRTCLLALQMPAFDPKRTSVARRDLDRSKKYRTGFRRDHCEAVFLFWPAHFPPVSECMRRLVKQLELSS